MSYWGQPSAEPPKGYPISAKYYFGPPDETPWNKDLNWKRRARLERMQKQMKDRNDQLMAEQYWLGVSPLDHMRTYEPPAVDESMPPTPRSERCSTCCSCMDGGSSVGECSECWTARSSVSGSSRASSRASSRRPSTAGSSRRSSRAASSRAKSRPKPRHERTRRHRPSSAASQSTCRSDASRPMSSRQMSTLRRLIRDKTAEMNTASSQELRKLRQELERERANRTSAISAAQVLSHEVSELRLRLANETRPW